MKSKRLLLILFFIELSVVSYSQTFIPEIENYTIEDYQSDNQNWGVDVDENGVVYVANNKGLLRYNGQSWKLFELPKKTIIRSVFVDTDKIYTGSFEEFGYWQYDSYGNLNYYSLTYLIKPFKLNSDEFWQIIKYNNSIVFRSFGAMFMYKDNSITPIPNSQNITNMLVYDDKLIVEQSDSGTKQLTDETLIDYKINGLKFNSDIHLASNSSDELFLYNDTIGGILVKNNKLIEVSDELNNALKKWVPNKITFLSPNKIAIGTIKNGVIIYDFNTHESQFFDKKMGLNNNTVLGLKYFNNKLWCALDNGISYINLNSSFKFFKDQSGILATVYDISFFKDNYYLASNTGLYTFDSESNLKFIEGSQGQIWNLSIIDNKLFCSHNKGIFYLEDETLIPLANNFPGVFKYVDVPHLEDTYLLCTYNGIYTLKRKDKAWVYKSIKNINFPVNDVKFETDNIIWATHPYKGLYRITLNEEYTEANGVNDYSNIRVLESYKSSIHNIENNMIIYNSGQWYEYLKTKDSIVAYSDFKDFHGHRLLYKDKTGFWFVNSTNGSISFYDKNENRLFKKENYKIKQQLVADYEKMIFINDSLRAINLNDGFVIANIKKFKSNASKEQNQPQIIKVYSHKEEYPIHQKNFDFDFSERKSISFETYTPEEYESNLYFNLEGKIQQEGIIKKGNLTLQNLPYGEYQLTLNQDDVSHYKISNTQIKFEIAPPWYLSHWIIVCYVIVLALIIYFIRILVKIKFKKEQMALKRLHTDKMKKRINQIEKQNLKNELIKTTDSIIRKNETIMVLYNNLDRIKDIVPHSHKKKINKTLSISKESIRSNKDWKIFERNFNEINQDFFKKLTLIQPKLTTKDLRLCAYVNTGLTSKKIAPLMAISERGVELHRYRLRKKLNIEKGETLLEFLRNV